MNKKNSVLLYLILPFVLACINESNISKKVKVSDDDQSIYSEYKANFDKNMIKHFPKHLSSSAFTIINNANLKKHDVALILYEYDLESIYLKKIIHKIKNKTIAQYKSSDDCSLIVNRFETYESNYKRILVKNLDSSIVNSNCFKDLLPIPNFIDYRDSSQNAFKLPPGFDLYVLEAKPDAHFPKYEMEPNPQMPETWKNGFSRGIAINEKERTVIYWGIIW